MKASFRHNVYRPLDPLACLLHNSAHAPDVRWIQAAEDALLADIDGPGWYGPLSRSQVSHTRGGQASPTPGCGPDVNRGSPPLLHRHGLPPQVAARPGHRGSPSTGGRSSRGSEVELKSILRGAYVTLVHRGLSSNSKSTQFFALKYSSQIGSSTLKSLRT